MKLSTQEGNIYRFYGQRMHSPYSNCWGHFINFLGQPCQHHSSYKSQGDLWISLSSPHSTVCGQPAGSITWTSAVLHLHALLPFSLPPPALNLIPLPCTPVAISRPARLASFPLHAVEGTQAWPPKLCRFGILVILS